GGRAAPRDPPHLLPAPLHPVPPLLYRRHVRLGRAQGPLHPSGRGRGRPVGGGGRLTLSDRQLASLARPPRLRPLRHHPELGGGPGEKSRPIASRPITSIGPSTASPGTGARTSWTPVPPRYC